MMSISAAKQLFSEGGNDAPALLEAARAYMDAHNYTLAEPEFWAQAELLLSAISGGDEALLGKALIAWKTSPGANGRITSRDPADERRIGVTDAAEAAGVTRRAVNYAIEAGRLKAVRNATGAYEIEMAEFRRWKSTVRAPNGQRTR